MARKYKIVAPDCYIGGKSYCAAYAKARWFYPWMYISGSLQQSYDDTYAVLKAHTAKTKVTEFDENLKPV